MSSENVDILVQNLPICFREYNSNTVVGKAESHEYFKSAVGWHGVVTTSDHIAPCLLTTHKWKVSTSVWYALT
jgi:hypothetical protein